MMMRGDFGVVNEDGIDVGSMSDSRRDFAGREIEL
jgi:hypothetical protein